MASEFQDCLEKLKFKEKDVEEVILNELLSVYTHPNPFINDLKWGGFDIANLNQNQSLYLIISDFLTQCNGLGIDKLYKIFSKLHNKYEGLKSLKELKEKLEKTKYPRVQWMLELSCHFDEIDDQKLNAIISHLQEISDDISLTLKKKERGSIKLTFEGSQEGMEKIKALFQSGQLTAILEIPIKNISLVTQVSATTEIINEPIGSNQEKAPQIFIAHASEDKPKVRELYERLKQSGFNPWLDEIDLLPGQNWLHEIPNALRKSDFVIACLSSQSVTKKGYVQREFKQALNRCAEMPTGTIYLFPLKLDNCDIPDLRENEYGINLKDIQWLNYWEEDSHERLVKGIEYQWNQDNSSPNGLSNQKVNFSRTFVPFDLQKSVKIPDKSPQTQSPVLDEKYKKLEDYLVHKKWEDADQEMLRLIMSATKRKHISFLQVNDFKKFDCSALRQIDQLWRKFSNDRFGFTIQRKIWKEIGGEPGQYKYPDFMEFCDCVGWRNNNHWLEYKDFTFTLEAPKGHFPSLRWLEVEDESEQFQLWEKCFKGFLSRIEICCSLSNKIP